MSLFGKKHQCEDFQLNHNCFPWAIYESLYYICHSVASGEFCGGLNTALIHPIFSSHFFPSLMILLFSPPIVLCGSLLTTQ